MKLNRFMFTRDFKVSPKVLWGFVISNIIYITIGILDGYQNLGFTKVFLPIGVFLLIASWIFIIRDIRIHRVYNKTFWILSVLIIIPSVSMLIYLLQRDRLMRD